MKKNQLYKVIFAACIVIAFFSLPILQNLAKEMKREMKMAILKRNYDESEIVTFSESELKNVSWNDKDEFSLNGKLYDVVKTSFEGKTKMYHCISDTKETIVLDAHRFLAEFFKADNSVKKFSTPKINQPNQQNNLLDREHIALFKHDLKINLLKNRFCYLNNYSKDDYFKILDPPRKIIVQKYFI